MNKFQMTPHRRRILEVLLAQGPIEDLKGQATTLLQAETGHNTTNALSGILQHMELAGLVARETAGRRTYRIALTRQGEALAKGALVAPAADSARTVVGSPAVQVAQPHRDAEVSTNGVDLDLLAGVLLKKALLATQAQEEAAGAKEALRRAQVAESKAQELEAELKLARDEAAELRAQVKTLEHNNTALMAQFDKVKRSPGTPIKDLISTREMRELDKLMRALPAAKG